MKELEGVTYFVPIPTGEMEHLKHPVDADRIIHSVPKVKRQSVSAIVVGVHDGDLIDLVFVHPNRVTTLSSGDWQNALERAYGVRPEGHPDLEEGDERLGYYEYFEKAFRITAPAGSLLPSPGESSVVTETKHYADGSSATGPAPLPDHSPAEQEALQPSAADLDIHAEEEKAKEATDTKKVRVIRGSKA